MFKRLVILLLLLLLSSTVHAQRFNQKQIYDGIRYKNFEVSLLVQGQQGGGGLADGGVEDLAGVDDRGGERPLRDALLLHHAVLAVQEQHDERLPLRVAEQGMVMLEYIAAGPQGEAGPEPDRMEPPGQGKPCARK